MSGALIAAPLRIEEVLIRSADRTLRVRRTGMGPGRAQAAASELGRDPAGALLVVGFCGGLDESSVPGEVIVADTVLAATDEDHGHEQVDCTGVDRLIAAVERTGLGVRRGAIVCVSRLALGERRAQLHEAGAIAVDMESVWLARGAAGRPFAVVRVVLDSPSHELMRPQAAAGAVRAARALRRVAGALNDWPGEGLR
jgi:4-hydroxy-3-methylbut-2-enyl diphosphate reductase